MHLYVYNVCSVHNIYCMSVCPYPSSEVRAIFLFFLIRLRGLRIEGALVAQTVKPLQAN